MTIHDLRLTNAERLMNLEVQYADGKFELGDWTGDLVVETVPRYLCRFSAIWDGEESGDTELLGAEDEDEVLDALNAYLDEFPEFLFEIFDLDEGRQVPWKVVRTIELDPAEDEDEDEDEDEAVVVCVCGARLAGDEVDDHLATCEEAQQGAECPLQCGDVGCTGECAFEFEDSPWHA